MTTTTRILALIVTACMGLLLPPMTPVNASVPFYNDADPSFLFIGNSYTSFNSLHDMFANIMKDGIPEWSDSLFTRSVNPGGRKLFQHLADVEGGGALQSLLAPAETNDNRWKWVVLQDQSQLPGFYLWGEPGSEFATSLSAAEGLDDYIEAAGGQTMFFLTWGRHTQDNHNPSFYTDFLTMQEYLTEGYMRYMDAASTPERPAYLAPVGIVFQTIHNDLVDQGITPTDPDTLFTKLYTGDGSHPAPPGTYAAALTIFSSMTGIDPTTIKWFPTSIDQATADALQDAVKRTIVATFESEFITYPWTSLWTDVSEQVEASTGLPTATPTQMPTGMPDTNIPTAAPITGTPTISLTESPVDTTTDTATPSSDTKGSVTIEIVYDEFPEDIAWTFLADTGAGEPANYTRRFFQSYNSTGLEPFGAQKVTFDKLAQNQTYLFKIHDKMGDGISGNHGVGNITIFDNENNTVIFTPLEAISFGTYYEVDLAIGSFGHAFVLDTSSDYQPGSWSDLENLLLAPPVTTSDDGVDYTRWPGQLPSSPNSSLVVNLDLYEDQDELSWELFYTNETNATSTAYYGESNHTWSMVSNWTGSLDSEPGLSVTALYALDPGWYLFVLKDSGGNGFSRPAGSDGPPEFVTITGPLSYTQDLGLVWGSYRQFEDEVDIQFLMDTTGYISHIRFFNDKDIRGPSSAGSSASLEYYLPSNTVERTTDDTADSDNA